MTLATLKRRIDALAQRLTAQDDDVTIIVRWLDGESWDGRGEAPMLVIAPGLLDKLLPDGSELLPGDKKLPDAPDAPAQEDAPAYESPYAPERKLFPHELAERRRRPRWTTR